jgi:hypothetical protein
MQFRVVCGLSTIEKHDLHNNDKMSDGCVCSQQFMMKRGVKRLRVSQLSGEKIK